MLYVGKVTSTKTGSAPYWMIGATVVGNPAATVMTSSPGQIRFSPSFGDVSAMKAKRAVSTILKVVSDEGFKIEDDITVQVYRHL